MENPKHRAPIMWFGVFSTQHLVAPLQEAVSTTCDLKVIWQQLHSYTEAFPQNAPLLEIQKQYTKEISMKISL